MTENASYEIMERFENPDLVPLENLKLTIKTDGVVVNVDALSKRWASDRYFLHYEAPALYNADGIEIVGAKDHWMEIVHYMIDDLKWLLSLPFYKFWSNVVFNTSILNALVSFLQEAPPFYALDNFSNYPEMVELLETLSRYVLVVFSRLVTNKESHQEYMDRPFLGNLLYENYIFTVPIIFDLCQFYGRQNEKIMEKILNCLFTLEPRYNNDLQRTIPCLIEALENVERKFNGYSTCYTNEAVSLPKQEIKPTILTLFTLEDMILYVLDISSTINVFLKNYPPAVSIFHQEDFMNKIVAIYENTIPEMYKTLDKLAYNDDNMPKYMELKHRLDVTRIEILNVFRIIIYEPILNFLENVNIMQETEIKERVDDYLNLLNNAISEKEFITDYNQFFPVENDLKQLSIICPEVDTIKCNYIMQSINAIIGKPSGPSTDFSNNVNEAVAGPSGISSQATLSEDTNSSNKKRTSVRKNSVELVSCISEVNDIFGDLDERFIEMTLQYYNYDTAATINAILEDTLPPKLKELKELGFSHMPNTAASYVETSVSEDLACGIEGLNVRDNYDYDDVRVKTREVIEVPTDYITKNYSLVLDVYDDEYDDTYDNRDIRGSTQDDSIEIDSRPFTTPRVLLGKQKIDTVEESESEEEDVEESEQNGKNFVQNPEEIRARAEQRRHAMRGGRGTPNVVGKARGQGQEKDVLYNRQQKNTQKAKRANHNRRSGAQWKRNQGMVPS
ncbi:unnamed protein product [Xylocopa violacea]|uniref:CUE domain-containing protein n=2 Tax=Xylocopa violacea TaxID=135666 RepID=A0ABP1NZ93_XYLVO